MSAEKDEDHSGIVALAAGTSFRSAYEIVRCIRAGGMGAVYEVVQKSTKKHRALKVMLPNVISNPELVERFSREATVAASIESEHVVETIDAGVDDATGLPFIVMELLKGEELRALLERGPLQPDVVVAMTMQIAHALDRTHAAGVVHRDLKPANLFVVTRDDGSPWVKVLDFGVAKILEDNTNAEGTKSVGSPLYMSPEQIRGDKDIGPRADLYALGHVVFTMLAGRAYWSPERRESAGVYPFLLTVMKGPQETASVRAKTLGVALPDSFNLWFAKATALEPRNRFADAKSLCLALAEALSVAAPQPDSTMTFVLAKEVVSSPAQAPSPASLEAPSTVVEAKSKGPIAALRPDRDDATEAPTTVQSRLTPTVAPSTPVPSAAPKSRATLLIGVAIGLLALALAAYVTVAGDTSTPLSAASPQAGGPATPEPPKSPQPLAEPPAPSAEPSAPAPTASAKLQATTTVVPQVPPTSKPKAPQGGNPLDEY